LNGQTINKNLEIFVMSNIWQVLKSTLLIDRSPWISLSEHDVVLPNGASIKGYITWEVREYALVVAITEKGIPLARQYKHGVMSFSLDLPGGYLETNETPLTGAKRELLEETGLIANRWIHLSSLILDNNRGTAKAHLFLASDIHTESPPDLDETEELIIHYYAWADLKSMVNQGQISSLPSVAALYMAMDHLKENS
jgi:ADP-ribose pyrophosphatase